LFFLKDVIGQLTVVHPLVQSNGLNGPSVRRNVELRDLRFVFSQIIFVHAFWFRKNSVVFLTNNFTAIGSWRSLYGLGMQLLLKMSSLLKLLVKMNQS
jgi:hypothetical protein